MDGLIFGKTAPTALTAAAQAQTDAASLKSLEADEKESLVRLSSHPLSRVQLIMNIDTFKV